MVSVSYYNSMEFVHHRTFQHKDVTVPKSNKSQSHVRFSAYCYALPRQDPNADESENQGKPAASSAD